MLKKVIGRTYDSLEDMQQDLECDLDGEVYFGAIQRVPFSPSKRRMEIYNLPGEFDDDEEFEEESYMIDYVESDDGEVQIVDVN